MVTPEQSSDGQNSVIFIARNKPQFRYLYTVQRNGNETFTYVRSGPRVPR
jgi:hypothetical protein